MIIKLKDIPLRKLFWIVLHCLINDSCLYTVQFGDITVEDDLLVAIYLKEMRFAAAQIPAKIGCSSPFFTLAPPDFFTPPFARRRWGEPAWFITVLLKVFTIAMTVGTHGVRPDGEGTMLASCAKGTQSQ